MALTWHCKRTGAYAVDSQEAYDNCVSIYGVLSARGWTVNAVCGVLGNMYTESGYNPWRWQSDSLGASGGSPWTNKGYGLVQFTPASKYIDNARSITGYGPNFSDRTGAITDGQAQMIYIDERADYSETSSYPLTFSEYKKSTETPAYLARAWLYNYERPADPGSTVATREKYANYWYEKLTGVTPPDPGGGGYIYGAVREIYRRILILR